MFVVFVLPVCSLMRGLFSFCCQRVFCSCVCALRLLFDSFVCVATCQCIFVFRCLLGLRCPCVFCSDDFCVCVFLLWFLLFVVLLVCFLLRCLLCYWYVSCKGVCCICDNSVFFLFGCLMCLCCQCVFCSDVCSQQFIVFIVCWDEH